MDVQEIRIAKSGKFVEIAAFGNQVWGSGGYTHSAQVLVKGAAKPISLAAWAKARGFKETSQGSDFVSLSCYLVPMRDFLALAGMSFDHKTIAPPRKWVEDCTFWDTYHLHHAGRNPELVYNPPRPQSIGPEPWRFGQKTKRDRFGNLGAEAPESLPALAAKAGLKAQISKAEPFRGGYVSHLVLEVVKKEPFFDHKKRGWALRPVAKNVEVFRECWLHWPKKAINLA